MIIAQNDYSATWFSAGDIMNDVTQKPTCAETSGMPKDQVFEWCRMVSQTLLKKEKNSLPINWRVCEVTLAELNSPLINVFGKIEDGEIRRKLSTLFITPVKNAWLNKRLFHL